MAFVTATPLQMIMYRQEEEYPTEENEKTGRCKSRCPCLYACVCVCAHTRTCLSVCRCVCACVSVYMCEFVFLLCLCGMAQEEEIGFPRLSGVPNATDPV